MTSNVSTRPSQSAISHIISKSQTRATNEALALEILHNLQYQHAWTDLTLHTIQPRSLSHSADILQVGTNSRSSNPETITLVSGLPPRHIYIHPDFQNTLIKKNLAENEVQIQREWVLPMSIGEKWTLNRFCELFDLLPEREQLNLSSNQTGASEVSIEWRDGKRVLTAMLSHNGMGGDGTIAYYIMQEGEIKPRQNG